MSAAKQKRQNKRESAATDLWLRVYVTLPAITAAISLILVFIAPSEGNNAFLLGISLSRWILAGVLLILLVGFGSLTWIRLRNKKRWEKSSKRFVALISNRNVYIVLVTSALVISLVTFYVISLTFKFTDQFIQVRLERLLPMSIWLFVFSLQNAVILPQLMSAQINTKKNSGLVAFIPTFIAFGSLLVVAIYVFASGMGLKPDRVGWDNPGVPLLATQITIAWFLGLLFWGSINVAEKRFHWKISRIDVVVAFIIWLAAIWSWQSQPLTPTFFSPTPRAPNFEFYPHSDAATHDLGSQNLLLGNGLPDVIEKPIYSLLLSAIHSLVGQSYINVVGAQIIVLALFPVVLYFLGARFHHRVSGVLLSFATIFREANSIALSGEIRVSHSKLLMTDLPTALAIAAFTLLVMRWLQTAKSDLKWPLIVGGAAGLLALLRSQVIVFVPVLLILTLWYAEPVWRKRIEKASLFAMGIALALLPWLLRNYQVNGQFGYSQPLQAAYLAKQYSLAPETATFDVPEGTAVADYASIGFSRVFAFAFQYPQEVASFVSAHFFHNEISSFLALPMRFDFADKIITFYNLRPYWIGLEERLWTECCSLDTYVADTPYWQSWNGVFPSEATLPILVNLTLVAIGIGASWRKLGWMTLVPILLHISYNVSTSMARVSGWRLNLPVDWVMLMFYCIGIGQVSLWVWNYFSSSRSKNVKESSARKKPPATNWRQQTLVPIGAAILLAGALLPLSEAIVPSRYERLDAQDVQTVWNDSDLSTELDLEISTFLAQPNAEILIGRAFYPRFYRAGEGEPGGSGSPFNFLAFPRIAFWVIGPRSDQIALPLGFSTDFPNVADVLVIGCEEPTYFVAHAVVFLDQSATDLVGDQSDPFVCD